MKLALTKAEIADLLPKIQRVLDTGEEWKDEELHHPAGAIVDAVLEIKGMKKHDGDEDSSDGFSTNGWQWDWWQEFEHNGKRYTLSGSGHHGGHSFHVSDSQ